MDRYIAFLAICWMAVVAFASGCSKKGPATEGPPDGYKSPYVAVPDVPPAPPPEAPVAPPPKSRVHPASADRPYPLTPVAEVGKTPDEKAIVEFLSDPKQGGKALDLIKKQGRKGIDLARRALACDNREARMQSALILANLEDGSKETVKALMDAVLLDPDPDARALAAKAFIKIEKPEAVPVLLRSLKEDPFEPARANAAWALGNIGASAAVQPLRDALKDEDTWVRLRAVSALKKMKARVAVPDLIERLADSNSMVRERAREALKDITGTDKGDDPAAWRR
jgi:HEAT repeat protein